MTSEGRAEFQHQVTKDNPLVRLGLYVSDYDKLPGPWITPGAAQARTQIYADASHCLRQEFLDTAGYTLEAVRPIQGIVNPNFFLAFRTVEDEKLPYTNKSPFGWGKREIDLLKLLRPGARTLATQDGQSVGLGRLSVGPYLGSTRTEKPLSIPIQWNPNSPIVPDNMDEVAELRYSVDKITLSPFLLHAKGQNGETDPDLRRFWARVDLVDLELEMGKAVLLREAGLNEDEQIARVELQQAQQKLDQIEAERAGLARNREYLKFLKGLPR